MNYSINDVCFGEKEVDQGFKNECTSFKIQF